MANQEGDTMKINLKVSLNISFELGQCAHTIDPLQKGGISIY